MIDKRWQLRTVQMTDRRHGGNEIEPEKLVEIHREGRYDKMVGSFNSYLGLLHSSHEDKTGRSEVLGIQNRGKLGKPEGTPLRTVLES